MVPQGFNPQTFRGEKVSKDRLRRVQGLSRHVGAKKADMDNVILIGDRVIFKEKNIPAFGK